MSDNIPAIGSKAPAFSLPNQDGKIVKLNVFTGKWVALYFYPKDNTPGCTTEACEFTDGLKSFEKLNAVVLGVSPDSPTSHQTFIEKQNLKITLLSDSDRKVMMQYGAFGTKKMYGKEVQGVIRSTYLIDPKGKIAYSWSNVKAAGHADKVKEKLAELAR
ncbi:MAG: thioredoxin-dependent thiol peroxidase [candidate division Zixibacteria bacterium HGW-Zixibacteria-1]|nr:MAG: thioredoxin-dependent thiol peroxidase [candidate division Zixibacteria bacterium HGW-Zixibacteria-1]